MRPTPTELKELNSLLNRFSDIEINDLISFLEQNDFIWLKPQKNFYHEKLQFSVRTQGLDLFVNNHDAIKRQLEELEHSYKKSPGGYSDYMGDLQMNKFFLRLFLFLVLGNLLLGWKLFSIRMWIFLEFLFILIFISLIRMEGWLRNKIDKGEFK